MNGITTHVLDIAQGRPASGVPVSLDVRAEDGGWKEIGHSATDGDGRAVLLTTESQIPRGVYRISFNTGAYFLATNTEGFFPEARIVFEVREPSPRCHVPLLLSPYGYSTYRGS